MPPSLCLNVVWFTCPSYVSYISTKTTRKISLMASCCIHTGTLHLTWVHTLLSSLHMRKIVHGNSLRSGLEESIFVTLDAAGDHFARSHLAYVHHEPPNADSCRNWEDDGCCMKKWPQLTKLFLQIIESVIEVLGSGSQSAPATTPADAPCPVTRPSV